MERQTHLPRKLSLVCPVVCGLLIRSVDLLELYRDSLKCMLTKEDIPISLQKDGSSEQKYCSFLIPGFIFTRQRDACQFSL